jgi:hypothetical protein
MYNHLILRTALFLFIFSLAILWIFSWPKESDRKDYLIFAGQSTHLTSYSSPICQNRLKVCKDLWFSEENQQRLHYRIESGSSSLTMAPKGHKVEVIERLELMRCWMQDKLLPSNKGELSQQTRYFTAREGVYHFLSQQLIADKATLSFYRMAGDQLPNIGQLPAVEPFLSGEATKIAFSISGSTPTFQAFEFKAFLTNTD